MKAGDLDRRVTFQRTATVVDPVYGPQPGGWADVQPTRIPAQVQDALPGKSELTEGGLRLADRPARLRIRYMDGLTSDMRVVVHDRADRVYEIVGGPAEIGRREWLEFVIKEYSTR
jgi:head-tail adaptor